jgi:SpoVK/Ycf46/Vps4 family AAA+-type ATPase
MHQDRRFQKPFSEDRFEDVGGLANAIHRIKRSIAFRFEHPEIARKYQVPTKKGFLFVGPPGNGKTMLGRCVAGFVRTLLPDRTCRFFMWRRRVYNEYLGVSERTIRQLFTAVRRREERRGGL